MSILDGIKEKATQLLNISEPFVVRQTQIYDSSKNIVFVAGMQMDGLVTSTISSDSMTIQENGIDYYYTTYYKSFEQRTLSISVLPTAKCLDSLRLLALKQQQSRGWFNISIHENDKIVNVYRAWVISLPEITMEREPENRVIVFGIKPMFSGVSLIDQPTIAEEAAYMASQQSDSVINEISGRLEDVANLAPLPTEDLPPTDD